jgi:hypothetical protein
VQPEVTVKRERETENTIKNSRYSVEWYFVNGAERETTTVTTKTTKIMTKTTITTKQQ